MTWEDSEDKESTERVAMTVRLKPEHHEQLRQIAFDRRTSIQQLLVEGIHEVLRRGKER